MDLIVALPWPPSCIGPNAKRRLHWRDYRGAAKKYRADCFALTRKAMGRQIFGAVKAVTVSFYPPDLRARDDDNMIGAFKAGRDGIAQAMRHDDKTWRGKVVYRHLPPHRPDGQITVMMEFEDE